MALEDFLPSLAAQIGTIPRLDGRVYFPHPDEGDGDTGIPDVIQATPCGLLLPLTGTQQFGGAYLAYHNLELTLYIEPQHVLSNYGRVVPYVRLLRDKLASKLTLGLSAIVNDVYPTDGNWYEGPKGYAWAKEEFTGIKFFITVKEHQTFTLAA